ncbi:unnamed protein product [Linum tenue]|uniref:Glutamine amidotransferase domain-containing protein n=1 Tax=Linum tenue TaxID=586396 RepID=A0AAV0M8I8_9ROSI|nr:unnamed protein product [Linum tenue]
MTVSLIIFARNLQGFWNMFARRFWSSDQSYPCFVCVWVYSALARHLVFHLKTSFFPHDLEPSFFPPWVETLQGVQFHPESIITSEGKIIVQNFLKMIEEKEAESTN